MKHLSRRGLLRAAAATPVAAAAGTLGAERPAAAQIPGPGDPPAPKYTLSVNLELMFPRNMAYADRIALVADQGQKAFSFWGLKADQADAMEAAQKRYGLQCGSITGNGKTGWNTGLTKTGAEQAFLDDLTDHIERVAKRFHVQNLICFTGEVQKDIPWEIQRRQIVDGLKRAGDLCAKHDVYFVLEPLNVVESPQMSLILARDALKVIAEVNHPHVKLDYDMYHRQLGEGNVINQLRDGLKKGLIRFVEIGDVPGRKEPGSGEANYVNIFKVLREEGYAGFVGMEHGTTATPEHAIRVVHKMAGFG